MISQDEKKNKWIDWESERENIIRYIEYETTRDFRHIAFNC